TSLRLGRGSREQCGRGAHPRASQEARGAVHPHRSRGGLPGEARAVTSLRARLLAWLMAGVVFVGAAGGWVVYRNALVEADAFFDYHLRQTALILRDQPVEYLLAPQIPRADAAYDFVVQVWSLDGVRMYQSRPHAVLPGVITLGFATVLNDLLARLRAALERERAFMADAAHELRTPLTALHLQMGMLARASSEAERAAAMERLSAGVQRAIRLVEQLLSLARQEPR